MKQFLTKCAITVTAVAGLCSTGIVSVAQADGHVLKIGMPLAMTGGLADEGKKQIDVWINCATEQKTFQGLWARQV